ncbi:MAG: hypothetical protein M1837_007357 [Sclerophora amabilis]|nr:MAG: hypothetical protein M1837_007357 [Sclerophora amabilis]
MDSKRKATTAASASPESGNRAAKRLRTPDTLESREDPEGTTTSGTKFLRDLDQARSKQGKGITAHFQKLPDQATNPGYYELTPVPVSIEIIGTKLNNRQYPTLTTLESDVKRMIANAKAYNRRDSGVFEDAERVRKFASSWMKENNPAYRDPKYAAFPTPLPGEDQKVNANTNANTDGDKDVEKEGNLSRSRRSIKAPATPASPSANGQVSKVPAASPVDGGQLSVFAGQSFQQVQESIVQEMIDLEDENGDSISRSFLNLPSRKLQDYYRLITKPMALNPLKKRITGQVRRNEATHHSPFTSWDEFEAEASLIWSNAKEYNEDDSEIYSLAVQLESLKNFFKQRLAEAKRSVSVPAGEMPRLKLNPPAQPTKIKLKVGNSRDTTATTTTELVQPTSGTPKPRFTPGVAIDNDAFQRQQQVVQAGVNGQGSGTHAIRPPSRSDTPHAKSGSVPLAIPDASSSRNADEVRGAKSPMPSTEETQLGIGLKQSSSPGQTNPVNRDIEPNPEAARANGTASTMPPPASMTPSLPNGISRPTQMVPQQIRHSRTAVASNGVTIDLDSPWRRPGQDISHALVTSLCISTHPALVDTPRYELMIYPENEKREVHIADTLESGQYYIQILPTLAEGVRQRELKMFVIVNGQRLNPTPQNPGQYHPDKPIYEAFFNQGIVNRVELDMCAGPAEGAEPHELDFEKMYFYAHVRKD